MKILDRYVISQFLKNYLISFFVLVGVYVVLDMVFNLDELADLKNRAGTEGAASLLIVLREMGSYYFFQSLLYFLHLSAVIPVVAAAFTLMRMVRFNELSAMLSAGVPLVRVAFPIVIVGLLLNALVWLDQEVIVPAVIPQLLRKRDQMLDADAGDTFSVSYMRDESSNKLMVGRYHPGANPPRMEVVDVLLVDAAGRVRSHIKADEGLWDEAARLWRLRSRAGSGWGPATLTLNVTPSGDAQVESAPVEVYKSNITPEEIRLYRSGDYVELLPTSRINELLERSASYGRNYLLRAKHGRFAQLAVNVILLLLGVACVLTREPRALRTAAGKCVALCGMCLALTFIGQELATSPPLVPSLTGIWPALTTWLPIFTFGPLSVWMLDRVKT